MEQAFNPHISVLLYIDLLVAMPPSPLLRQIPRCNTDAMPTFYSHVPKLALEVLLLVEEHGEAYDRPVDQQTSNY